MPGAKNDYYLSSAIFPFLSKGVESRSYLKTNWALLPVSFTHSCGCDFPLNLVYDLSCYRTRSALSHRSHFEEINSSIYLPIFFLPPHFRPDVCTYLDALHQNNYLLSIELLRIPTRTYSCEKLWGVEYSSGKARQPQVRVGVEIEGLSGFLIESSTHKSIPRYKINRSFKSVSEFATTLITKSPSPYLS